ncbi:hypothetical protein D3P07_20745 [Paenibacillus sp. 1011MAR3C5]|uniref:hypothetical protein n=1 Tax=Paenibacillus sp. 1011MAR3C5 TaxID=1675787 RepID=UPI000E6C73CC|nr:hypothetical protein [Paenibacillus sp. 1011MAR3C5]RJE85626.1 hypothetical protein D3P07_20745 [Paenibacillus sp. 1011MAR3C5]
MELILLIIGCYAVAALFVHLAFWIGQRRSRSEKHYVLIAGQAGKNMEWYLRMLHAFSRWLGRDIRLTVVDAGASEETMAIVERWKRNGKQVHIHSVAEEAHEQENHESGKRSQSAGGTAVHLLWMLQAEGIVSESDHAVLVDLQNPSDLSKMPF